MAYNPREPIPDGTPVEIVPMASYEDYMAQHVKKPGFYIEFYPEGKFDQSDMESGVFHTNNLKHFITVLVKMYKYRMTYLRRESDGKQLWPR